MSNTGRTALRFSEGNTLLRRRGMRIIADDAWPIEAPSADRFGLAMEALLKHTEPASSISVDRLTDINSKVSALESDVRQLNRRLDASERRNRDLLSTNDELLDLTARLTQSIASALGKRDEEEVRSEFTELAARWREETSGYSLAGPGILHPDYLRIIGMGAQAIPWILEELSERGGQWFVALQSITGEDPVPEEDRGRRPRMRAAWQNWGRAHGWIE